ncbi:MAG: B12-binding domain-containing radical SAM protein [Rhodopirellula sp.]|nr:B12-binding domain-containing radical SAM protein [Rhodopirellula sp.]
MAVAQNASTHLTSLFPTGDFALRIQLLLPAGEIHRNKTGIFKRSLRYAPLTLTTLAALIPQDLSAQVEIQDEGVGPIDLNFDADLVGISAITGTANRSYELADTLRARGHKVVLGGVHPTLMPTEAAQHADAVVSGYAENSWPELLRDFAANQMRPFYQQPTGRRLDVPIARREMLDPKRYATVNSIEATRGCPHRCEFCAVPAAWGGIYAHRPIDEVIAELETFDDRKALFIDLSPVENVKYAKELYRRMIPLRMKWVGLATTRIAEDQELLKLAAESGCRGLLIGFEAIDQATLDGTRKQFHSAKSYAEIVKRLHDHGIGIQGCFVFGFDNDGKDVFERTVEFVDRAHIDLPRYAVLTPFPGTAAYKKLDAENRLLHRDWSRYDVEHVVFRPAKMTPEQLQEGLHWAWKQSYGWSSITRRLWGSQTVLPLSLTLNVGYRYFAQHLADRTPVADLRKYSSMELGPACE